MGLLFKLRTATERKLAMTKYYLQRMRDTQNNLNPFDFECELESFLTHAGSITNLPRSYYDNWFMEKEYGQKKGFREWYDKKALELQSNEIMMFLRDERNIVIHFNKQIVHTICNTEYSFIINLAASSSFKATIVNIVDRTEETVESTEKIIQPLQETRPIVKRVWEFNTNTLTCNKEVISVCEKYFEILDRLVEECRAEGF